jgi:hypothetical protein
MTRYVFNYFHFFLISFVCCLWISVFYQSLLSVAAKKGEPRQKRIGSEMWEILGPAWTMRAPFVCSYPFPRQAGSNEPLGQYPSLTPLSPLPRRVQVQYFLALPHVCMRSGCRDIDCQSLCDLSQG